MNDVGEIRKERQRRDRHRPAGGQRETDRAARRVAAFPMREDNSVAGAQQEKDLVGVEEFADEPHLGSEAELSDQDAAALVLGLGRRVRMIRVDQQQKSAQMSPQQQRKAVDQSLQTLVRQQET